MMCIDGHARSFGQSKHSHRSRSDFAYIPIPFSMSLEAYAPISGIEVIEELAFKSVIETKKSKSSKSENKIAN